MVRTGPLYPWPGAFLETASVPDRFYWGRRSWDAPWPYRPCHLLVDFELAELCVGPGRVLGPSLSGRGLSVFSWGHGLVGDSQ